MRIVDIRETAIPLKSNLRNSGFDFSKLPEKVVLAEVQEQLHRAAEVAATLRSECSRCPSC